jgi:hypothetical protein
LKGGRKGCRIWGISGPAPAACDFRDVCRRPESFLGPSSQSASSIFSAPGLSGRGLFVGGLARRCCLPQTHLRKRNEDGCHGPSQPADPGLPLRTGRSSRNHDGSPDVAGQAVTQNGAGLGKNNILFATPLDTQRDRTPGRFASPPPALTIRCPIATPQGELGPTRGRTSGLTSRRRGDRDDRSGGIAHAW